MVYIDGIQQQYTPHKTVRPASFQKLPKTPNFDQEAADAVKYDGLPPLKSRKAKHVTFVNVTTAYIKSMDGVTKLFDQSGDNQPGTVVALNGKIACASAGSSCLSAFRQEEGEVVDLGGGSIMPGLTSFGSQLGLTEVQFEPSTNDGNVHDPLIDRVPPIVGGDLTVIRAVDGLSFGGRNAL